MNKFDDEFDNGRAFDGVPDNEFELEMSDLPPDEEAGIAVVLASEALRVLSDVHTGVRSSSNELIERGKHRLDSTREWLLEEKSAQTIREYTPESEFELEVSDLPLAVVSNTRRLLPLPANMLELFARFRSRLPFKRRLWRVILAVVTILLMLAFLLASTPGMYESIIGLFVHPATAPTASNSSTFSSESSISIQDPSRATA